MTSESLQGAKHGGGNWEIKPNTASFVLTLNRGSVDSDILDRLLPIELEAVGDARTRKFTFDPALEVKHLRNEIIGEVMSLAVVCLQDDVRWEVPKEVDRRFSRWMEFIGAMLQRRGLPGFMSSTNICDEQIDPDMEMFERLTHRVYTKHGENWVRAKDIVEMCRSGGGNNNEILFEPHLNGKTTERTFAKYVLLPKIDKRITIARDEQDLMTFIFEMGDDQKNKSKKYRFVPIAPPTVGGDGGDVNMHPRHSSPPLNSLSIKGVKVLGGDNGDKSLEPLHIENTVVVTVYSKPILTSPATPAIPAIPAIPAGPIVTPLLDMDPWQGGSI